MALVDRQGRIERLGLFFQRESPPFPIGCKTFVTVAPKLNQPLHGIGEAQRSCRTTLLEMSIETVASQHNLTRTGIEMHKIQIIKNINQLYSHKSPRIIDLKSQ